MIRLARAAVMVLAFATVCNAQQEGNGLWPTLRRLLLPDELAQVYELRESLRVFPRLSMLTDPADLRHADLRRLDSIYARAVELCEGDIEDAMLICAGATLPYHRFPAVVPLAGLVVWIPVSSESTTDFERRLGALPAQLFVDSPPTGDRDKLPHFFGSAWMFLRSKSVLLPAVLGYLIEIGETMFKLEGAFDDRDITANTLGIRFGQRVLEHIGTLPSDVLIEAHKEQDGFESR